MVAGSVCFVLFTSKLSGFESSELWLVAEWPAFDVDSPLTVMFVDVVVAAAAQVFLRAVGFLPRD